MNKKNLSLVLGVSMIAASVLSLAGCGHKHDYEVYYRVADCNNEGYTMHVCTDCGYTYADEFIAPYGHAYRNYFHPKEESVATYALEDWGSSSHNSATASLTPEQLQAWQESGKDACVHKECEFCHYQLPEDAYLGFLASVGYLAGMNYEPIMLPPWYPGYNAQPIPVSGGDCSVPSLIYYPPRTPNARSAETSSEFGEFVLKTTVYANEFNIDEAEYDKLHMLLPDCIETIEDEGFGNCEKLERVYLSKNLKTIGKNVFKGSSLDSVLIPKSLQSIGTNAFANCTDLKIVYFSGAEEEWNAIQIDGGNDLLKNAPRYYYSESKPTTSGNFWHYVEEEATPW